MKTTQQLVDAYLAAGGTITICPPMNHFNNVSSVPAWRKTGGTKRSADAKEAKQKAPE